MTINILKPEHTTTANHLATWTERYADGYPTFIRIANFLLRNDEASDYLNMGWGRVLAIVNSTGGE